MPTYSVQGPSGKTYTIDGPEGASAEDLGRVILSQSKEERVAVTRAQMAKQYNPVNDMTTMDRLRTGIGQGMTELARGAGQWVGAVDRQDVKDARELDAPLMNTTAGKVGSFVGKAVPVAASSVLIPGAATLGGATALGALTGAIEPSASTGETLKNIGFGGVAGGAGQKIGGAAADWLSSRATNKIAQFAASQAGNAQKVNAARDAAQAGYVVPPSDVQPQGGLMEALGGLSGKIKTAQVASARNQGVTDELAKKAVGLNADDALTRDALKQIRQQAGNAYDQFRTVGQVPADAAYTQALDAVLQTSKGASRSFPGLKADKVEELVQNMRQPSFDAGDAIDATKVLRDLADGAFTAGDKQLAKAYKSVSNALEDSLDRHLQQSAPGAVDAFRDARRLIAKTYTVEKALNGETGQVSAAALAAQLRRGKPLSDELLTIAKTGEAFPRSMQALKEAPKTLSPLDFGTAGLGLVGSGGNPLAALGLIARPAARESLLSKYAQQAAMADKSTPGRMLADAASSPLMRLLYGPGAAAVVNARQK